MHQEMYAKALTLYLLTWVTAALNLSEMKAPNTGGAFIALPMDGDVYPSGYYTVTIGIGSKYSYVLDVDTGSDLTWVQCVDTTKQPPYYVPENEPEMYRVPCGADECKALGTLRNCDIDPALNQACEFKVQYSDGASYKGTLYIDWIHLELSNGTKVVSRIAFGCAYPDKPSNNRVHQKINGGILGLGKGDVGILKQLSKTGLIGDVVGHCLSSTGGGYISLGNSDNLPSNMVWQQLVKGSEQYYYSLGAADLLFDGNNLVARRLWIILDSGSTYTYFSTIAYRAVVVALKRYMVGKPLTLDNGDKTLPMCWKGPQPFGSIRDAAPYFPNLALSFGGVQNVFGPKHYLVISEPAGNACLGILDGGAVGLGNKHVIGDLSMQDKLMVYDNENGRVGWAGVPSCSGT